MNATKATLLLVDDDRGLVDILTMSLQDAGFEVASAHDGKAGWAAFRDVEPDLVLLDVLMPELDGLHLCQMIREKQATPIIMLTSRDQELDKVLGLEMGADDYVTKPFSTRELIARIRAALRRVELSGPEMSGPDERRRVGPLELDRGRREVALGGSPITLTATEFELLWTLTGAPGRVFERHRLIDKVYGVDIVVADRTIDTFVKRIRHKFRAIEPSYQPLETVRGVGYKFLS